MEFLLIGFKEKTFDRARVAKYGQMALCTRVGGKTTRQMVREDLSMQMAMSTMVSGKTIRRMVTASTAI